MMNFENDIQQCLEVLNNGGIILYPTDTVWGIGADATNAAAVEKIYSLKKRPGSKAMIVLVADERDVLQYTASPDLAVFDYLATTTKPTTVIYEGALGLAHNLVAEDGSIAIRICRDTFCKHLIKRFRKPIVSTSANFTGEPTPSNFQNISELLKSGVDYIVRYGHDIAGEPSAVIMWKNGEVIVLRP